MGVRLRPPRSEREVRFQRDERAWAKLVEIADKYQITVARLGGMIVQTAVWDGIVAAIIDKPVPGSPRGSQDREAEIG